MKFKLEKGITFKKIIDILKDLVEEGTFTYNDEGVSFKSLDSSHIAYIHLDLDSKDFDYFETDDDGELHINLINMSQFLKCLKNNQSLTMKNNDDVLSLIFENPDEKTYSKFDMRLLDLDYEEAELPEIEFDVKIVMNSNKFLEICKDLSILKDEIIKIKNNDKTILFKVNGDMGKALIRVEVNENIKKIKVNNNIDVAYGLSYFNKIAKCAAVSSEVTLYITNEMPLIIKYEIDGGGTLDFYVSPKIN